MSLAPGDALAGYTVIRSLGAGGMGAVYLVHHPRLPRSVALKLLRPELAADPGFSARFLHEADMVARLSHRNVVDVFDRGEDAGQLWLTMKYIDGIDAETALDHAGGLLPSDRAVHIVSEVAAALDHARKNQVLHRDIKPSNILLAPGSDDDDPEWVFLTDFGIAKALDGGTKVTKSGAVIATFDYASPEQIESGPLDARSDIYSLGCVLYRLLTGSVPFPGFTVAAALHGHLNMPPPRPTKLVPWLAPAVDDVVARALAKDPADRYDTCRALATAARRAITQFPPPPSPPYTFTVIRNGRGDERPSVGALCTDQLPTSEVEQLTELLGRTRFFDLPERLARCGPAAGGTTDTPGAHESITIEIACRQAIRHVTVDLVADCRPPAMDELLAMLERFANSTGAARASVRPPPPRRP